MNTNKRSAALAFVVIVTAVALVIAGSLTTSTLAVKSHKTSTLSYKKGTTTSSPKSVSSKKTKSETSSLSKFFSCVRAAGKITRAAVDNCYGTTSSSSSSVLIPLATP
jgi:hypothetical protein